MWLIQCNWIEDAVWYCVLSNLKNRSCNRSPYTEPSSAHPDAPLLVICVDLTSPSMNSSSLKAATRSSSTCEFLCTKSRAFVPGSFLWKLPPVIFDPRTCLLLVKPPTQSVLDLLEMSVWYSLTLVGGYDWWCIRCWCTLPVTIFVPQSAKLCSDRQWTIPTNPAATACLTLW